MAKARLPPYPIPHVSSGMNLSSMNSKTIPSVPSLNGNGFTLGSIPRTKSELPPKTGSISSLSSSLLNLRKESFVSPVVDDDSDDEVLEESPCGRWQKRKEEVKQRDVPGIDAAFLAMDNEDGVEVVWNEIRFSQRKNFLREEKKIKQVFDTLITLDHPNIVKFHGYWIDLKMNKMVFISEYMSCGSLQQFLKKSKSNQKKPPIQMWKRWCTQILSALCYLHSFQPPIIHGNLTTATIFIQHNGLIKIGRIAPDTIQRHVKSCNIQSLRTYHYLAPEYATGPVTPSSDIYSFGVCALETAALEIQSSMFAQGTRVTTLNLLRTLRTLTNSLQKDFIRRCLRLDPKARPTSRQLLLHPVLFEVHSLKLLAAHTVIRNTKLYVPAIVEEIERYVGKDRPLADLVIPGKENRTFKLSDVPIMEKLESFMEDVKFGVYPLTAFALAENNHLRQKFVPDAHCLPPIPPERKYDEESRRVLGTVCNVRPRPGRDPNIYLLTLTLRFQGNQNRQLTCEVIDDHSPAGLARELVTNGLISPQDEELIRNLVTDSIRLNIRTPLSPRLSSSPVSPRLSPGNPTSLRLSPGSVSPEPKKGILIKSSTPVSLVGKLK